MAALPPGLVGTPYPQVETEADSAVLREGYNAGLIPGPPARAKAGLSPRLKQVLLVGGILVLGLFTLPMTPRIAAGLKKVFEIKEPEQEPARPVVRYKKLGLPTVEEAEERMPDSAKKGKRLLAKMVGGCEEPFFLFQYQKPFLVDLARGISRLKTDEILGLRINLTNVTPIHGRQSQSAANITVKVTRVVDVSHRNILLEVLDETSARKRFLRLTVETVSRSPMGHKSLKQRLDAEFNDEMRCVRQACAGIPPNRAVERRGLALPYLTAVLQGAAPVTRVRGLDIYHRVQLMDSYHGELDTVRRDHLGKTKKPLPAEVKEYAARRLLLAVMHLQETRVVHNNFDLLNMYVLRDGSVLLGNFSSAVIFKEKRRYTLRLNGHAVEPQLAIECLQKDKSSASITGHPAANLWSLGIMLCDIFANGNLPYEYEKMSMSVGSPDPFKKLVEENPPVDSVRKILEEAGTPEKWTRLICKLTSVRREDRITTQEIVRQYPELLGLN